MSLEIRSLRGRERVLYLVDISSFIFRAFYAIRSLSSPSGEPTNAVYGVATMLAKLMEEVDPRHLVVVYDSKEPSFRSEMYEDYKANRTEPPDDLVPQFERIYELIEVLGIPSIQYPGVEADDLIATLADHWRAENSENEVIIVSGDKDLMQLVDSRLWVWDTMKGKLFDSEGVFEKFGVRPDQVRDYLAIVGDSSDNVPGVSGIGPKGAAQLLSEYGDVEGVLKAAHAGQVKGKKGETLLSSIETLKLAQELVSLKRDCKIPEDQGYAYQFRVGREALRFFEELGFHSLVKRFSESEEGGVALKSPEAGVQFQTVRTRGQLEKIVKDAMEQGALSFDLETTSLNPRVARIAGIALAVQTKEGFYVPLLHEDSQSELTFEEVMDVLSPYFSDSTKTLIGQNLKFDLSVLDAHEVRPQCAIQDTMLAAYVLEPTGKHGFDFLCQKYLNYAPVTYEEVCGKGKQQITFDAVPTEQATRYAAEDAVYTLRLWELFKAELEKENLWSVYEDVDLPLVRVLEAIEMKGVVVDVPYLKSLSEEFEKDLERIRTRVDAFTREPINLNSPKQLAVLLFDELKLPVQSKTKTGRSTDSNTLEALAPLHEVPRLLLEYREISKLKGTYVDPLPELIDSKTGRIHAHFHQTVTATGRLSSSDPNLQNIPIRSERGRRIRRAFVAPSGARLVAADYSQIELRILAHMSGDPVLCESFQKGEDVHRRTALEIFGGTPETVSDEQRAVAKAINFGLMYGKTAFGLAQELGLSRADAKSFIDRYFERYAGVKVFLEAQVEKAKEQGYVETLCGRRRLLPELASKNGAIRAVGERMAMNTPIQGTAADLMKLAMIKLHQVIQKEGLKARMIIQVHDELVLECPESEVQEVTRWVRSTMEGAMQLSVPLVAEASEGGDWLSL